MLPVKRRLPVIAMFVFLLSNAYGQDNDVVWSEVKMPDIKVQASFPCKPAKNVLGPIGRLTGKLIEYRCTSRGAEYRVSLLEYAGDVNKESSLRIVDESEKTLKALSKDIVVSRTTTTFQSFQAIVLDVKSETILRKYIFVSSARGQIGASITQVRAANESTTDFAAAFGLASQKFVDSLKVLSAK